MESTSWRGSLRSSTLAIFTRFIFFAAILLSPVSATASSEHKDLVYSPGTIIPIECLNRTIDSGEHVQDEHGVLQYIPFLACAETRKPLEFRYFSEDTINCTITLDDHTFHLWEFYIHHDSPLACRVPMRPAEGQVAGEGSENKNWIPLVMSLAGNLDTSHLHIGTSINLIFHTSMVTSEDEDAYPGTIDSATAYSVSPLTRSTRVIIGDPLPLSFTIRWYTGAELPPSDSKTTQWGKNRKYSGHVTPHTLAYCVITAICTAAICTAYCLGWEFPKRMRRIRAGGAGGGAAGLGQFVGRMGTPLGGFAVGPGKAGGYGMLSGNSSDGDGANGGWYTKKD